MTPPAIRGKIRAMSSPCPICKSPAAPRPKNPNGPFCSARCKTIDLGRWLSGDYTIPVQDEGPSSEHDVHLPPTRGES